MHCVPISFGTNLFEIKVFYILGLPKSQAINIERLAKEPSS
jgi:hypothetical protein